MILRLASFLIVDFRGLIMDISTLKLVPEGLLNIWTRSRVHWFLLLSVLVIVGLSDASSDQLMANSLKNSPISYIQALVGHDVLLPCDVTPPSLPDAPILVLFYREDNKTPIFSLDSRGLSLSTGIPWSANSLESRAYMKTLSQRQGLFVGKIQMEDAGLYRCRVDFKASPTRNSRVQLKVIDPPKRISITSSWNEERMEKDVIGPYPEGAQIILSCQVIGGLPPPQVTWWDEGSLLDDVSEVKSGGLTRNSLHLPKLTRADLLKRLTCIALNSNLTSPVRQSVTIDLAYPPSAIRISPISSEDDTGRPLADKKTVPNTVICLEGVQCPLECKVSGSRPPPVVTWKMSDRTLEAEFQTISNPPGVKERGDRKEVDNSSFYSTLMLTAKLSDDGAIISCKATSPALQEKAIEDSVLLNVLYKPQLKLKVRDRINLQNVEENEDVELECSLQANPSVSDIQWTRNWIPLVHNETAGVYMTEGTLVLSKITSDFSGQYACAAANSQGAGTSNVIRLLIKFAPRCSSSQLKSVGIAKAESANVTCRVDAHPPATIFRWAFNTSEEMIDIPFDQQIEKNDSSNTITYSPRSPFDYGHVLCWASNAVGTMKRPCVIKILPIDKPEGVRGCKIFSNGSQPLGLVILSCQPGWDGGLSQGFTLEVRKASHSHARALAALQHSKEPVFHLRNLQPGQEFLFTVTAANPRGTSPPVTLTYKAPPLDQEEMIAGLANKHSTPDSSTFIKVLPFLAIFFVIVVVLTTCVSVIACVARSRSANSGAEGLKQPQLQFERKPSLDSGKESFQEAMSPDGGKLDDLVDAGVTQRFCAVHGRPTAAARLENEYVAYTHYFNNVKDDFETQHLLKSSIGSSAGGVDNHCNGLLGGSGDSSSNYNCRVRPTSKELIQDLTAACGRSDLGGDPSTKALNSVLAPLASVDSLSGYSSLSNHSTQSRKFPIIPEKYSFSDGYLSMLKEESPNRHSEGLSGEPVGNSYSLTLSRSVCAVNQRNGLFPATYGSHYQPQFASDLISKFIPDFPKLPTFSSFSQNHNKNPDCPLLLKPSLGSNGEGRKAKITQNNYDNSHTWNKFSTRRMSRESSV